MTLQLNPKSMERALEMMRDPAEPLPVDYKVVAFKEIIFVLGVALGALTFVGHGRSIEEALASFGKNLSPSFTTGKRVEK